MEPLIVVTYPDPVALEARAIDHESIPDGNVGIGYYFHDSLIARSVVTPESVDAIHSILSEPVSVALAATVDTQGNIDGRVCLVLPVHGEEDEEEEDAEPWRASVPTPPAEIESGYGEASDPAVGPRAVLLPIGNVVRNMRDRNHPNDAADDAREMLDNLLAGQAQDAVAKAIDDLLRSV